MNQGCLKVSGFSPGRLLFIGHFGRAHPPVVVGRAIQFAFHGPIPRAMGSDPCEARLVCVTNSFTQSSVAQSRPFDLLVFLFWSIFSGAAKRLTFYFWVLWASEKRSIDRPFPPGETQREANFDLVRDGQSPSPPE